MKKYDNVFKIALLNKDGFVIDTLDIRETEDRKKSVILGVMEDKGLALLSMATPQAMCALAGTLIGKVSDKTDTPMEQVCASICAVEETNKLFNRIKEGDMDAMKEMFKTLAESDDMKDDLEHLFGMED